MRWIASPQVDDDLIAGRNFIAADNMRAAIAFLDVAFDTFESIATFPKMGTAVRLKNRKLKSLRFVVLPHPFNRWLVFYRAQKGGAVIVRVLYGTVNWRQEPGRFF